MGVITEEYQYLQAKRCFFKKCQHVEAQYRYSGGVAMQLPGGEASSATQGVVTASTLQGGIDQDTITESMLSITYNWVKKWAIMKLGGISE